MSKIKDKILFSAQSILLGLFILMILGWIELIRWIGK